MYHKGDLELETKFNLCDSREEHGYDEGFLKHPFVCLPHSCSSWIIGGPAHARQLVADLEEAIRQMEKNA